MDLVTAEVISEAVLSITCVSPVVILQLLLPPQLRRNRYSTVVNTILLSFTVLHLLSLTALVSSAHSYEIRLFLMVFRWIIGFILVILCVLLSDGVRLQQTINNNAAAMTIRASIPRSPPTLTKAPKTPLVHSHPISSTDKDSYMRSPPSPSAHIFSSTFPRAMSPPSTQRPVPKLIMRENSVSDLNQSRGGASPGGVQMVSMNSGATSPPSTQRSASQVYYTFPVPSAANSSLSTCLEQPNKSVENQHQPVSSSAPMSPVQEERALPMSRHRIHVNPPPHTVGQIVRTISGIPSTVPSTSALPLRKGHSSRAAGCMSTESSTRSLADDPEQSPIQLQRLLIMPDLQGQVNLNDRNLAVSANEMVRVEYTPSASAGPMGAVPTFGAGSNHTSPTLPPRTLSPSFKQTRSFSNSPVNPDLTSNGLASGISIGISTERGNSITTPVFYAEDSEVASRMMDTIRLPSVGSTSSMVMPLSPKARERLSQATETTIRIHSRTHSAEWNNQELQKTFITHSAGVTRQPSPSQIDRLINAAR